MSRSFVRFTACTLALALLGIGCKGAAADVVQRLKPITIEYWRTFDDASDFAPQIEEYKKLHPNVRITYKKFRPEEYERALLEAFAEDRGPDIFSIHNTWVGAYEKKIAPIPKTIEIPKIVLEGAIKKEQKIVLDKKGTPSPSTIKKDYVDVVASDVVREVAIDPQQQKFEKKIFGIPYAVDTLALYVNNDMLAQAGIATPPKTWEEFQNAVKLLTKIGQNDTILQSGAALGTANNINRSGDIVSLLMMQNGAQMTDAFGRATFHQMPPELASARELAPGIEALIFYTEFANPLEPVYTWNAKLPESMDAFADGKTTFFFGYAYHMPLLKTRAPKLNYTVIAVPQLNPERMVNYASYWVETVSKKTKHVNEAWDFVLFMADKTNAKKYLEKTKRPTALRGLVKDQLEDPQLEVFVNQLITAKSWYRGKDSRAMETILKDMIEEALANAPIDPKEAFENAINRAVTRINQTL